MGRRNLAHGTKGRSAVAAGGVMQSSATQVGGNGSADGEAPALLCDLVAGAWPANFRAWVERVAGQSDPADPLAGALVERLALAAWRLRRLTAADMEAEPGAPSVQRVRLSSRTQADRDFSRALADLIRYRRASRPTGRTAGPATPGRTAPHRSRRPGPAPCDRQAPGPTDGDVPDDGDRGRGQPESVLPDAVEPAAAAPVSLAELASRAPADWACRFRLDPAVSPHWPVVRGSRRLAETVASALVTGPTLAAVRSAFADLSLDDLAAVARLETLGRTGPWPPGLEDHAGEPGPSR